MGEPRHRSGETQVLDVTSVSITGDQICREGDRKGSQKMAWNVT